MIEASLPQNAPLSRAAAMLHATSLDSGVLLGMGPSSDRSEGPELRVISRFVSEGDNRKPVGVHGTAWATGMAGASAEVSESLTADKLREAVAQAHAGMQNLGREIPAAQFDTVEGAREVLASIGENQIFVQLWHNGQLATRVLQDNDDSQDVAAILEQLFVG